MSAWRGGASPPPRLHCSRCGGRGSGQPTSTEVGAASPRQLWRARPPNALFSPTATPIKRCRVKRNVNSRSHWWIATGLPPPLVEVTTETAAAGQAKHPPANWRWEPGGDKETCPQDLARDRHPAVVIAITCCWFWATRGHESQTVGSRRMASEKSGKVAPTAGPGRRPSWPTAVPNVLD